MAPLIKVERPILNRRLEFVSADEVLQFLDQEDRLWEWTNSQSIPNQVNFAIGNYRGQWTTNLRMAANNLNASPDDPGTLGALVAQLEQRFRNRNEWCSRDQEAWEVHQLAKDDPSAAAVAMAVLTGREEEIDQGQYKNRHGFRRGRAKGYSILAGVDPKSQDAVLARLEETKAAMLRDADSMRDTLGNARRQFDSLLQTTNQKLQNQVDQFNKDHSTSQENRETDFQKLKTGLEGITAAYETQMQLRGPVRYWRLRAEQHRKTYRSALAILVMFSVVSVLTLYFLYDRAAEHLPTNGATVPYAALFKATAFALLMTTIAFWTGRILLRVYLSAYHLATDAEERRTMIMTFLALTKSKSVEEKDRELILTALFRPGSDGIVKDDAAPEVGALIQNLMRRP